MSGTRTVTFPLKIRWQWKADEGTVDARMLFLGKKHKLVEVVTLGKVEIS